MDIPRRPLNLQQEFEQVISGEPEAGGEPQPDHKKCLAVQLGPQLVQCEKNFSQIRVGVLCAEAHKNKL